MCYNQVLVTHLMCSCILKNVLQPFCNTCECVPICDKICYNQVVVTHLMRSCISKNVLQPFCSTCECVAMCEKMCSYIYPNNILVKLFSCSNKDPNKLLTFLY
jgi:hypothetical protein